MISVLLNIGLNFVLIPKYGMYGAAIATFPSYLVQFIIIFFYSQSLVKVNYDYFYVIKSVFIGLSLLSGVIFITYLNLPVWFSITIRIFIFSIFLLVSYKYLKINRVILFVKEYQK